MVTRPGRLPAGDQGDPASLSHLLLSALFPREPRAYQSAWRTRLCPAGPTLTPTGPRRTFGSFLAHKKEGSQPWVWGFLAKVHMLLTAGRGGACVCSPVPTSASLGKLGSFWAGRASGYLEKWTGLRAPPPHSTLSWGLEICLGNYRRTLNSLMQSPTGSPDQRGPFPDHSDGTSSVAAGPGVDATAAGPLPRFPRRFPSPPPLDPPLSPLAQCSWAPFRASWSLPRPHFPAPFRHF